MPPASSTTTLHRVEASVLDVFANGLVHRVLAWAASEGARPAGTVVLIHGYMDAAATWDLVAPILAHAGYRVLAPNVRGYGDHAGARTPPGSYYHFVDYVFDLADILDVLCPTEPALLVGHSMGGTIATLFAGTFPERVQRLATLEGLGPPDNPFEAGPSRMRRWIQDVRAARARGPGRPTFTREEGLARLAANHPAVPADVLAHRLTHLAARAGDDGMLHWHFDPLHRTTSPTPFFARLFAAFAAKVTCPVLFVSGGPTGYHPPDEEDRLGVFPSLTRALIDDAGHMMHWTKPAEVAAVLLEFFTS